MPYDTTFAGLKADIITTVEDQSIEVLANLDSIIALSETVVLRDLDLELFQGEAPAGSTVAGNPVITRPAILAQKSVWITVGTKRVLVQKRSFDFCLMYAPDSAVQVAPTEDNIYYAERDDGSWYLAPTPDAAYVVGGYGIVRPDGLSSTNPTTWLSTYVGDLLLKACLIQTEKYLKNTDQVAVWKDDYADLLAKAQLEFRGAKRGDYELARQASNATAIL